MLGVDFGGRRIGLAISDPSGTLARPLMTLRVASGTAALDEVARTVAQLAAEDDGLEAIVVGVPRHLDGSASDETLRATQFMDALKARTVLPVHGEDERLTSHEANSRLAAGERDWRQRKKQLDAAAAAVILQDFLDRRNQQC